MRDLVSYNFSDSCIAAGNILTKLYRHNQKGRTVFFWCALISSSLAEWTGLEPATPGVTGRYSNQLNYHSWRWWVLRGSNPRPSPCKGDALPAELSTQGKPLILRHP